MEESDPSASGAASVGVVRGVEGDVGLAMMKLPQAVASEDGRVKLLAGDAMIEMFRPQWWSQEWGREEEGGS